MSISNIINFKQLSNKKNDLILCNNRLFRFRFY